MFCSAMLTNIIELANGWKGELLSSAQLLCKCQGLEQVAPGGQTSLLLSP